jgi:hypothetical protein
MSHSMLVAESAFSMASSWVMLPSTNSLNSDCSKVCEPGVGVGVGIERETDGVWSVSTVCDTLLSDRGCRFDVLCSTDDSAGIAESEGVGLEPDDELYIVDDFAVQADLVTRTGADTFRFRTTPTASVRFSVLLYDPEAPTGWSDDPRLISWVGGGGLHWGAPANPIDLLPNLP